MSTEDTAKPVLLTFGDPAAAACDPNGEACALPTATRP